MSSPDSVPEPGVPDAEPGDGQQAWRLLVETYNRLMAGFDADLRAGFGIDVHDYDVLLHLGEQPDQRIRMTDLARAVAISKSGLTTLVDRMERSGWVARTPHPGDRRATLVELTPKGRALYRGARAGHRADVHRRFVRHLTPEEHRVLSDLLRRLRDAAAPAPQR